MPTPEGIKPVPKDVLDWANSVGFKKTPTEIISVPRGDGRIIRATKGVDLSDVPLETLERVDELAREYAALYRDAISRQPEVKTDLVTLTTETPQVSGAGRDSNHGNFNVTVIYEKHPVFDDEVIAKSLGEKASLVYGPILDIALRAKRLLTQEGEEIPHERTYQAIRHALLELGASEESVDAVLTKTILERLSEQRDNEELARQIKDGVPVEGITFKLKPRIEVDDIDKSKPITVRRVARPKRKMTYLHKKPQK